MSKPNLKLIANNEINMLGAWVTIHSCVSKKGHGPDIKDCVHRFIGKTVAIIGIVEPKCGPTHYEVVCDGVTKYLTEKEFWTNTQLMTLKKDMCQNPEVKTMLDSTFSHK